MTQTEKQIQISQNKLDGCSKQFGKLVIMRHGNALISCPDSTRELTMFGKEQAKTTALFLREKFTNSALSDMSDKFDNSLDSSKEFVLSKKEGSFLEPIVHHIYSSDYLRAYQTASEIAFYLSFDAEKIEKYSSLNPSIASTSELEEYLVRLELEENLRYENTIIVSHIPTVYYLLDFLGLVSRRNPISFFECSCVVIDIESILESLKNKDNKFVFEYFNPNV